MNRLSRAWPKTLLLLSIVLLLLVTNPSLLEAKLYECAVGCDSTPVISTSSVGGDISPSGVSPAAVTLTVTALQAAGVQVRAA
jgi:hypothetical protein